MSFLLVKSDLLLSIWLKYIKIKSDFYRKSMPVTEILTDEICISLINNASDLLRLSLSEIETKYANYPLSQMDSIDNKYKNVLEIRFDKEQFIFTCLFDKNNECFSVCLFSDTEELLNKFIYYLTENIDYDFLKSRWLLPNCFLKIESLKDVKGIEESLCLKMYL